jgi:hypothetical protein
MIILTVKEKDLLAKFTKGKKNQNEILIYTEKITKNR